MNVLGIETSCDETAAAVVQGGTRILSSIVRSQVDLHRPYGGVVPEIASRSHVELLPSIVEQAVAASQVTWSGIDVVAVTYGPGLASSLLVGLSSAKALAMRLGKPLCVVNHLEAHVYSVFLGAGSPSLRETAPFVALIVSGGHTCLVRVGGLGDYRLLGRTIDDAAGEAFDKGANLLGLGYPGGPAIDKAGRNGRRDAVAFPRGRQRKETVRAANCDPDLCFSFSGLKTALRYYLKDHPVAPGSGDLADIAASYQEAIVDALVMRCARALESETFLIACGGVSLNSRLRERLSEKAKEIGVRLLTAEPDLCMDNAAMVAGLAGAGGGVWGDDAMNADVMPNLPIG